MRSIFTLICSLAKSRRFTRRLCLPVLLVGGLALVFLPCSCISSAASAVKLGANLITNNGFESGMDSWKAYGGLDVSVSDTVAHSGSRSLKLTNDGGSKYQTVYNTFSFSPGLVPEIKVWVKTDALEGKDKTGAYVSLQYLDAHGTKLDIAYITRPFSGVYDWTLLTATANPSPEGTTQARFGVHLSPRCKGLVYYDDVSVIVPAASRLRAIMKYPNYRSSIPSGGARRVAVSVEATVNPNQPEASFSLDAQTLNEGSAVEARASLPTVRSGRRYLVEMELPSAKPGSYTVVLKLKSTVTSEVVDSVELPFTIEADSKALPQVYIDSENRCIVDGKPFFPMGFYTWRGSNRKEAEWLSRFKSMGFNCVLQYSTVGPVGKLVQTYLDEADKQGIKIVLSVSVFLDGAQPFQYEKATPGFGSLQEVVNTYKSHPALLAWYLNDEMSDWFISQLKKRYDWIKANDPQHPVYQVLYAGQPFERHLPSTDIIGSDKYPNFGDSRESYLESPIWSVTTLTDSVQSAVLESRPVWMVVSCCSKVNAKEFDPRPPTYQEVLCMSYQAVIHGSRGLFYFVANWMNDDGEAQWQVMTQAGRHLSGIQNIFLGTDLPDSLQVTTSDTQVSAITREAEGKVYVLAVNPFEKDIDCTFKLPPACTTKSVSVETPGMPAKTLNVSHGSFRETIEPNGVRVYRLVGE